MKQFEYPKSGSEEAGVGLRISELRPGKFPDLETSSPVYDSREELESGGLLEYWLIVRRRKGLLLAFAFIGGCLGFLVGLPQTPVYRAHTSVEVLSLNEDFLNMKQTNPVSNVDASYETSEMQTQISLLHSASLLQRVVDKLQAKQMALDTAASPMSGWRKLFNVPQPSPSILREKQLARAAKSLKVVATGRTRLIDITIDATVPKLAADFANTLDDEFIEQNLESHWKTSQRTSDWLGRQLDEMRVKLERSENVLQAYAKTSGLVFTDEKTNVSAEKLRLIQQQLSSATGDRIAKQSKYELTLTASPDSLADVLNDDALSTTEGKIIDLRSQIADLSATYTPGYAKVKRLEAQLADVQASFNHDRAAIVDRIKNDYQQANRQEALLLDAYRTQTKEVTGEGEKSIQYNILMRDVDSNRQLYETMLQQLKESSIASALRASNVRVVDPAEVPLRPFSPDFVVNSVIGLLGGSLLGFAFVVMRERVDRTLQDPADLQQWTNSPVLGVVPTSTADIRARRAQYARANQTGETAGSDGQLVRGISTGSSKEKLELISWQHKPSVIAEAFRTIVTSVMFAGVNGSRPRLLVLTSADSSDGKTTIASNLSIALADIGQNILIIDADLRRPRMHDIFDLPNEEGLTTLLRGPLPSDEAIKAMVHTTNIPRLHVLTAGPSTFAAVNLLHSPNLPELLSKLRRQFDMIMVDTPPMLQIADARVVGRLSDAVVLIARAGKTTRDAALAAKQRLNEDSIRMLGTILNDLDPRNSPYGGYYGYYNHYKAPEYERNGHSNGNGTGKDPR